MKLSATVTLNALSACSRRTKPSARPILFLPTMPPNHATRPTSLQSRSRASGAAQRRRRLDGLRAMSATRSAGWIPPLTPPRSRVAATPLAARDSASALYANAQIRLARSERRAYRACCSSHGRHASPPRGRITSALSLARSLALPTAIPTDAAASTGPSFKPSPTIATRPCPWIHWRSRRTLSSGSSCEYQCGMASAAATWATASGASPLSRTVCKPRPRSVAITSLASETGVSASSMQPCTRPAQPTYTCVPPGVALVMQRPR